MGFPDAEHPRYAWAVDVHVENPDCVSLFCKRGGDVGRHGALAHAALTGQDDYPVLDFRELFFYQLVVFFPLTPLVPGASRPCSLVVWHGFNPLN
jgi:hypothetical protein